MACRTVWRSGIGSSSSDVSSSMRTARRVRAWVTTLPLLPPPSKKGAVSSRSVVGGRGGSAYESGGDEGGSGGGASSGSADEAESAKKVALEAALDHTPDFNAMSDRDRAFARAITAATFRRLGQTRTVLNALLSRPLHKFWHVGQRPEMRAADEYTPLLSRCHKRHVLALRALLGIRAADASPGCIVALANADIAFDEPGCYAAAEKALAASEPGARVLALGGSARRINRG
mgnify:CR=1 FL=1